MLEFDKGDIVWVGGLADAACSDNSLEIVVLLLLHNVPTFPDKHLQATSHYGRRRAVHYYPLLKCRWLRSRSCTGINVENEVCTITALRNHVSNPLHQNEGSFVNIFFEKRISHLVDRHT